MHCTSKEEDKKEVLTKLWDVLILQIPRLTIAILPENRKLAFTSSIAFCLSPPSLFMSSFYTESIFALLSFTGMRYIAKKQYMKAALVWGITSSIRSNAIVFAGFFFYDLVWVRSLRRIVRYYCFFTKNIFILIFIRTFIPGLYNHSFTQPSHSLDLFYFSFTATDNFVF